MTYQILISNAVMQKDNYVDAAKFLGWNGDPETDNSWIDVIQNWLFAKMVDELGVGTCQMNEGLYGKLNYNASQWIEAIRSTTTVSMTEI